MQKHLDIAIAGAGLTGRLLAWHLLRRGHKVTLYEAGHFDRSPSAAHTAAAMISPMSEVVVSERAIYDMGQRSLALWPEWLDLLKTDAPKPVQYSDAGSVVVAHAGDLTELEQFYQDLNYHLGADNNARWLDSSELHTLEPDLSSQFDRGLYLPGEAHLDNRALLDRLLEAIKALGGRCIEQHPLSLNEQERREGPLQHVDLGIDCRGVGAKSKTTLVYSHRLADGHAPVDRDTRAERRPEAIRGVRGEVLWVATDEVQFHHPVRLMHPRYKLYAVPKPNGRFIIGATEIESEDRSPVSVQSMLELCSALYTLNPAFAEARIVELDANLRPAYLDNMPRVDLAELPAPDEAPLPLLTINGLYRHGYLLAPKLVEDALQQVEALAQQTTGETAL